MESLKATVIADKLSCRYGPGAEYLYLFALNGTANIKLIGRTDANNWVLVENSPYQCWVNAKFLEIQGDPKALPIVYPGWKLIVSPYYPGPSWANATRNGNSVEITWEAVPISPGKYADEFMHQYIVEVWRCEAGRSSSKRSARTSRSSRSRTMKPVAPSPRMDVSSCRKNTATADRSKSPGLPTNRKSALCSRRRRGGELNATRQVSESPS